MFPITKVIEKAMLPIKNIPAIDYIMKEAIDVSIKKVIIVMNENQRNIKDYLLMTYFNIEFIFVYQNDYSGLGKAIMLCEKYFDDEYFYVSLPDELFKINPLITLKNQLNKMISDTHLIGTKKVSLKDTKKYGIVKCKKDRIIYGLEKPLNNPPSNIAIIGRYLFNRNIFSYLKEIKKVEIGLSNAIFNSCDIDKFYSVNLKGERYDIGNTSGYKKAFNKMKTINKWSA